SLNPSPTNSTQDHSAQLPIAMLRHRGCRGKTILQHRAFQKLPLQPWTLLPSAVTAVGLTLAWLPLRAPAGRLWTRIFQVWLQWLRLPGAVTVGPSPGTYFEIALPRISTEAPLPDAFILMSVTAVALVTFFISLRLPAWMVPLSYFL